LQRPVNGSDPSRMGPPMTLMTQKTQEPPLRRICEDYQKVNDDWGDNVRGMG
jgi:hypothetical protein